MTGPKSDHSDVRSSIRYRVGIACDPQPEDKYYDTEQEAIDAASSIADDCGWRAVVAVWDDRRDPVYVFYLGEVFRKV